jgi:hypothetical protein
MAKRPRNATRPVLVDDDVHSLLAAECRSIRIKTGTRISFNRRLRQWAGLEPDELLRDFNRRRKRSPIPPAATPATGEAP